MKTTRRIAFPLLAFGILLNPVIHGAAADASPASTLPLWHVNLIPLPTNLRPGSVGSKFEAPMYRLIATNIGGKETSGPVSFSATLPPGIKPVGPVSEDGGGGDAATPDPSCEPSGTQAITCTAQGPVYPGRWVGARIPVEVAAPAGEVLTAKASVGGGGPAVATATTSYATKIAMDPPGFGFLTGAAGASSLLTTADGSSMQAGSRPHQLTINLAFPTDQPKHEGATSGAEHLRDLITDLPRGLVANPRATLVRCTEAELLAEEGDKPGCPAASQVGTISAMTEVTGPAVAISGLYNMVPTPGAPGVFGFDAVNAGVFVHVKGGLRSDGDYGISSFANDIPALTTHPVESVQAQLWGDPSGSSHDEVRGECRGSFALDFCPVPLAEQTDKPFLTMPSSCSGPIATVAHADSWEEPGVLAEAKMPSTDLAGAAVGVNGCSTLEFEPALTVNPDASTAETPTGVHIDLEVPQNEGKDETATSNLKDTTVVFPAGMAVNPAAASGLKACTPSQIGLRTKVGETPIHFTADRPQCPDAAKIGTLKVDTPVLDHPVPGAVYVAQPYENPFGTLLGVYVVIDDPADGIVAKLAGKTEANPDTGQLTTKFEEAPELPFEHFKVDLFGGSGAVLRTPSTCGTFNTTGIETPWSGTAPVHSDSFFQVSKGANGGPCASTEAQMPNNPSFEAGTQSQIAGSYSPFLGRLSREDGTQQLTGLNMSFPPGLTGRLAGTSICPEGAIEGARTRSGQSELSSPSCPDSSLLGEVKAGAGAGPNPFYTSGEIYLAGPYKGAPFSAAVITPAVAGPFDLGTVVVRAPAYLNPATAEVSIKSDPAPHILQGIPLDLRDLRLSLARNKFILNPTSCDPMAISGSAVSLLGASVPLSQRFQVGGCRGLDFEPKLALRLFGKTRRGAHPRLKSTLTAKPGEANVGRVSVALPRSEFLENAHIGTVCTRVQFSAEQCPDGAIYGHAKVITPLLDEALEGPVYLRSSSHKLPDMVLALKGPPSRPIKVELDGRIDSINGGIRATFEAVPDQPFSKAILTMQGGKKGLLVNSRNLCAKTYRAAAKFNGQNGKVHDFSPALANDCKKKGKTKRH